MLLIIYSYTILNGVPITSVNKEIISKKVVCHQSEFVPI